MAKRSKPIPKPGDAVRWETSQGTTTGTVKRVVRQTTTVKGHIAKATPAHPEVVVESDATGAQAVHRPEALHAARRSPRAKGEA